MGLHAGSPTSTPAPLTHLGCTGFIAQIQKDKGDDY